MDSALISLKKYFILVFLSFLFLPGISVAEQKVKRYQPGNINHIVVVWFKQGIDSKTKKGFIESSKSLSNLPGVLGHSVGQMLPSDRVIVDSTFDVAVVVTVENKAALKAYLDHPTHKEIVKTVFRPVADKVLIYDVLLQ